MVNNWSDNTAKWLDDNCFKGRYTESEKCIVNRIKEAIKDLDINNVYITDFGCGTGRFIDILKKEIPQFNLNNYLGMDTSKAMLDLAESKNPNVKFLNFENNENIYPVFDNDKFDILVCLDVLQHQNKPITFINELMSLNPDILFIEFWAKQDGQNLDKADKIITLQSTNESFYENIFNLASVEEFANEANMSLFKHDADKDVILMKTGLKQINDLSDVKIIDEEEVIQELEIKEIDKPKKAKKNSKKV